MSSSNSLLLFFSVLFTLIFSLVPVNSDIEVEKPPQPLHPVAPVGKPSAPPQPAPTVKPPSPPTTPLLPPVMPKENTSYLIHCQFSIGLKMETHEFIESKNLVQEFYTISKIRLKVNEPLLLLIDEQIALSCVMLDVVRIGDRRCKCVPPGTYGNREKCGRCYTNMTTHGGRPKCP
ncbi:hypothetical protein BRARA_I00324 [Brassica rapa]|uniref:Uncharacterized protein n=1 Tax=Brassica campestris TaxID=3711 RepID=A0A397XQI7_BRACM|nr:hypothetical protein BRARA_I00324 [Brassica rapa]